MTALATGAPDSRELDDATALVGMSLFLGSAAVLFGSLLMSYAMLRTQQPSWSAPAPLALATVNTLALACSSVALALAERRAREGARAAAPLALTMALGLAFLAGQLGVWRNLGAPAAGLLRSVFILLAGSHAAHLAAAIAALAWAFPAVRQAPCSAAALRRLRLSAMFWHFLGAAWAALFVTLFLL
ncbi:MAG: cytochrome c oxidase subunit 3 [Candidatus Wallbacteria bacterium]|nr:cytochrome c oxidase subunit 3 [Candidatus Wallbacteria bacterium]